MARIAVILLIVMSSILSSATAHASGSRSPGRHEHFSRVISLRHHSRLMRLSEARGMNVDASPIGESSDSLRLSASAFSPAQSSPTPTPGTSAPVDFTVLSVRAEAAHSRPDWNLVKPPLKAVKVGAGVLLSVYYHVSSAQPNLAYSETVTVRRNGVTLIQQTYPDELGNDPLDTYRNSWAYAPSAAGSYTITIAVTMGDQTQGLSTALTVQKNAPVKAAKTSFTLDRIQLLDLQGRPKSTFRAGAQFYLLLNYTVSNLHARLPAYVAVTFELRGTGKALYPPTQAEVTAVNGRQSGRTRFFAPNRPGSVLKIVAGLTIGSTTHQKSASLSLTG